MFSQTSVDEKIQSCETFFVIYRMDRKLSLPPHLAFLECHTLLSCSLVEVSCEFFPLITELKYLPTEFSAGRPKKSLSYKIPVIKIKIVCHYNF